MDRPIGRRVTLLALGCLAGGSLAGGALRAGDQAVPPDPPIDAATAVRLAEEFIRANGYTDFEPPDPARLAPETLEMRERPDWLARRRGTLRSRAVGYLARGKNGPDGWTVGFERARPPTGARLGRAVTMDSAGKTLVVQHKDLILRHLGPRPADPRPPSEPPRPQAR